MRLQTHCINDGHTFSKKLYHTAVVVLVVLVVLVLVLVLVQVVAASPPPLKKTVTNLVHEVMS